MTTRLSNRIRKATNRLDPSNSPAKRSPSDVHQVSDNSSCENSRPQKKARASKKLKEPKRSEYIPLPLKGKEYEMRLPLNPKAGLYPDKDKDGYYFAEDVVARKQKANGAWEFKIRWLGYDQRHDTWEPFSSLNDFLRQSVYEKYTLKQRAPTEITPVQQEEVDRAIAETKKRTDERNEDLRRRDLPFDHNVDADQFDNNTVYTVDENTAYFDKDYIPDEVEGESAYGDFDDIDPDTDIEEYYFQTISEEKTSDYASEPYPVTPDMTCGKMLRRPLSTIHRGKFVRSENSVNIPPNASLLQGKTLDGDGKVKKPSRRVSKQSAKTSNSRAKKSKASVTAPRGGSKKKPSPLIAEIRKKIGLIGKRSKLMPENFSEELGESIVPILEMLEILLKQTGFCDKISTTNDLPEMDSEPVDPTFHDASYVTPGDPNCYEAQKRLGSPKGSVPEQRFVNENQIHAPYDQPDFNFDEESNSGCLEAQKRLGNPKCPVQDQSDVSGYEIHIPPDPPGFNLDEETNNVVCLTQTRPSEEETQPPGEFVKDQSVPDQSFEQTKIQDKCQNEPLYDSVSLNDDDDDDHDDEQVLMGGYETQEEESSTSICDQNFVSQSDSLSGYHSACDDDYESGF